MISLQFLAFNFKEVKLVRCPTFRFFDNLNFTTVLLRQLYCSSLIEERTVYLEKSTTLWQDWLNRSLLFDNPNTEFDYRLQPLKKIIRKFICSIFCL